MCSESGVIAQERVVEKLQKEALQVTKEIVVKFIEVGRISPANLGDIFPSIYTTVLTTITSNTSASDDDTAV